ncbi:MAG: hypothetical protein ABSG74_02145 [Candidatus Bathyarchaeia archaeon]
MLTYMDMRHTEIKPHLSLNVEALETPIQAFEGKQPLEKTEAIQTTQDANNNGKLQGQ